MCFSMNEIKVKPIGIAKNQEKKHFGGWRNLVTEIIIKEEYKDALDGLKNYSHLIAVYWMHDVNTCDIRHSGRKETLTDFSL